MKDKRIGYVTRAFMSLDQLEQQLAIEEFNRISHEKDDWLYVLREGKVYAQEK